MNPPQDMGERQLTALIVRMVALVVLALVIGNVPRCMYRDHQRAFALSKGADPLGVACVFGTSEQGDACALAASTKNQ